jgi:hypothetical protein
MIEFNKQVNWQTHTGDVNGMWSNAAKAVTILEVSLRNVNDEYDFGELCARFDTKTWNCNQDGLIYTDGIWINEFRALMRSLGFTRNAVNNINYSEQGMQGYNFVSMDVGEEFLREVEPMHRWLINRENVNA